MGAHERAHHGSDNEWLTPRWLVEALGEFDCDPCSPVDRPWDTAQLHYTIYDDGLSKPWPGRVWLNPPYGSQAGDWMGRLANHGNGIALIFARTETESFFRTVWERADALYFLRGRLTFHYADGRPGKGNAGAPSVLVAYGANNADVLAALEIPGQFVRLKYGTTP
jgi:hypothetical protein